MRILVLADTHIPDHARRLPSALLPALRRADLILHAGDVTVPSVIDELEAHAPVRARHDGMRLFNPGSPTWKRRESVPTYGWITISVGGIRTRIVPLEP